MTQGQKDFLALSHGQEWVSFYESFDKLVQDNLSRSSELLRRAMSLPEVADREVQQIRSEMEGKLNSERSKQRELLSALQDELSGSHRQVSMLARSVGMIIGDLERLNQRVGEAMASIEVETAAAAAATPGRNGVAPTNGVAQSYAPVAASEPAVNSVFLPDEPELPEVASELELPTIDELPADFNLDDIAAAVEEQQAMLEAAEDQLENLESSIDLSALAEAEVASEPEPRAEAYAAVNPAEPAAVSGEQRPRPHWLSVTRTGART